jgi:NADPH:quinone reductase-like Zn-dependent oxidoreductase
MKAAVIRENGGLDVIRIEDIPKPQPAADEVLVRVRYAGLNHLDIWARKGRPGVQMQWPHVLGSDGAGVVEALGSEVKHVKAGDTVVVYPGLGCGCCEACERGEKSLCPQFGIVGMSRPGTFAEYVVLPAGNVFPKPPRLSMEEAGGFVLAYLTAWRMLMTRAQVKPGEAVLIHGVGGGVALCALQFAKLAGAEAIVTSSSADKLERAMKLGADATINYKTENVTQRVRDLTGGRGVDVVVDSIGAATWPLDLTCVTKGGRVVLCGVTTGAAAETDLRAVYWNQLTLMGSTLGSIGDLRQMFRAVTVARLKPVIDEVFPLSRVRDAVEKMEMGRQFGKIVLHISD